VLAGNAATLSLETCILFKSSGKLGQRADLCSLELSVRDTSIPYLLEIEGLLLKDHDPGVRAFEIPNQFEISSNFQIEVRNQFAKSASRWDFQNRQLWLALAFWYGTYVALVKRDLIPYLRYQNRH